jgi:TldD protein
LSVRWRVAACDDALAAALEAAAAERLFLIGRLKDQRGWSAAAQSGKLEQVSGDRSRGLGVQVFTLGGHCGFASTDRVDPTSARQAVQRAGALARAAEAAGGQTNQAVFGLGREPVSEWPCSARPLDSNNPAARQAALLEAHRQALDLASGLAAASSLSIDEAEWRIVRSDGTDVRYRLARGAARHAFTTRGSAEAASTSCAVAGADDSVLMDAASAALLLRRARQALGRARDVVDAPTVRAGSYRLVLDHAMAKGLAHESFGHAAETDHTRDSVLATDGRLRLGERVGPAGLSIVDGPIAGDYADQPCSANGLPRQTVEIIRAGRLHSGLGDLFSADEAGSAITGACRTEGFRSRPMPRISNIRLVLDDYAALHGDPEELSPADLRDQLAAAGFITPGQPTLLLSGYRGGQVSPALGDFVFNCAAIYDLTEGARPLRPAIFSGKSLSALNSVVGALGALQLDAPGRCVKGNQGVTSSGGSQAFVVLERHPEVTVGAH